MEMDCFIFAINCSQRLCYVKKLIILIAIFILVVLGIILIYNIKSTSLEVLVLNNLNEEEITLIEVIRGADDKEVVITTKKDIESFIDNFTEVELRKDNQMDANSNESY